MAALLDGGDVGARAQRRLSTSPYGCQTATMRQVFAHQATLTMELDADARAPGAAITVAICGHWEHEPPCPLSPHHTRADRVGGDVQVRTLFATKIDMEDAIRRRIDGALSCGQLLGPDGAATRWQVLTSRRSDLLPEEADHAQRLMHS